MAEKLVRDKIKFFSDMKKDGRTFRSAKHNEFPTLLSKKLKEETEETISEILAEPIDIEKLTEELGDCLEVIETIALWNGISLEKIKEIQSKKFEAKGGFRSGLVLTNN